jgi:lipopolysaccharide export system protein LptA
LRLGVQRTIRVLRVALPIAFLAFIALIVLNWRRQQAGREQQTSSAPSSVVRPTEEKPVIYSKTFEDTQTIAGRVVMRIRAEKVVGFQSGWTTLEDVHLTIYRPSGLTYELICPQSQFNSSTKEADAKGGVQLTSSDGVEVKTAEIHFDGNRLTNHIPVEFKIDRWKGLAGGLDLDVQADELRLIDKLTATMTPVDPNASTLHLESTDAVYRRKDNDATFNNGVILTRDKDRLTSDHVVGRFTADRKTLVGLEGNGNVNIGFFGSTGGRNVVTCDRFWSEIGGNGQINAMNATGEPGLAHAVLAGPPARDVVARTFRAGLQNREVSELRADSGVVMKELGPQAREMTGEHLLVTFDPATHKAISGLLDGNFSYRDPRNEARAVRANYDIAGDRLILSATPGFDPTVTSDGNTLKAKLIEFSPRAGTAKASGSVIAQLNSKQAGPTADGTNIFPASRPVFVNSDSVTMKQSTKTAVFSGNVRAWQETNTMFAQELQVQGAGDSITARGDVRTTLYNATGGEQRKTPVLSRSDHLVAHRNDRRLELTGNVKIDDEQRKLSSEKATFFFDATRRIERIEAETKVVLTEQPTSRKGTGDKAIYLVNRRVIYFNGTPATMTDPKGTITAEQFAIDLAKNKVEVMSPTSATQGTYKQQQ